MSLSRLGTWSHILPCRPPGHSLRSAGQVRRDQGHDSPSGCVHLCLASPLPVQASGNAVIDKCYFSGDIVKVSFYCMIIIKMFKTSQNITNRRVSRHEAL